MTTRWTQADVDRVQQKREPSIHDAVAKAVAVPAKKRLRQSSKPRLNKLETAWLAELKRRHPEAWIHDQAIKLELAHGMFYKCDFFVIKRDLDFAEGPMWITAYETKGPKVFRGGFENLKVAARAYPWIKFVLVWRDAGVWQEQHVLP